MPIDYKYDRRAHRVTTRFRGTITRAELEDHAWNVNNDPHIHAGSKELVDLTDAGTTDVDSKIMKRVVNITLEQEEQPKIRRRAFVAGSNLTFGMARMYEIMSEAAGSATAVRTFRTIEEAERWLDEQDE